MRPTVNLDPILAAFDKLLSSPAAPLVEALLPATAARVRAVRDNLPEVLSTLEGRALQRIGGELDRAMQRAIASWLAPTKRRAKKKAAPKRLKGKGA